MCFRIKDKPRLNYKHFQDDIQIFYYFIGPECAPCIKTAFRSLSFKSRKMRFNSPVKRLSKQTLDYLTNIDNRDHIGIIAEIQKGRRKIGLGVGRCKRIPEKRDTAELAVTVVDKYQNKGIGTGLTAVLSKIAMEQGIRRFHAHVNRENISIIKLIEKFKGRIIYQDYNEALYEIELNNDSIKLPF
jgi:acetyltransferase